MPEPMYRRTTVSRLQVGDRYVLRKADIGQWRTAVSIRPQGERVRVEHNNESWFGWHYVKGTKRCYKAI